MSLDNWLQPPPPPIPPSLHSRKGYLPLSPTVVFLYFLCGRWPCQPGGWGIGANSNDNKKSCFRSLFLSLKFAKKILFINTTLHSVCPLATCVVTCDRNRRNRFLAPCCFLPELSATEDCAIPELPASEDCAMFRMDTLLPPPRTWFNFTSEKVGSFMKHRFIFYLIISPENHNKQMSSLILVNGHKTDD